MAVARGRHWAKRAGWTLAGLTALLAALEIYPNPAFAYAHAYRGFAVASDRPIDPAIDRVLGDAERRLSTSPLYRPGARFRIFICNQPWRLKLFAFNGAVGGGTIYATRNIFIREADIAHNRMIAPGRRALLDPEARPLSYFIAHEATHVLELRRYGLAAMLSAPFWLVEGYADYVAKAGDFDMAANRALLLRNDRLLGEALAHSGLYRRYHLMVAALLSRPGASIDALFAAPPSEAAALRAARGEIQL